MTMLEPDDRSAHESILRDLLLENVEDYAIYGLSTQGVVTTWARGAQNIKGYGSDEIIGQSFEVFFTPEDRAAGRPQKLLTEAREQGRVADEGWRLRKGGERFWASTLVTALRDADREIVGFAKITRDLTERRRNEEALRKREHQLLETQRLAGLGSWDLDISTGQVTWTDELYRIYGLTPGDGIHTFDDYLERVHPEDRERVRGELEAACRTGSPFEFEERIVRPSGEVRILHSRGEAVRDENGRTDHVRGACLDITALRAAQEKAIQLVEERAARAAAEEAERGLRFLVQASELLASSLDYERTLKILADITAENFADWCAVDLLDPAGAIERVAVAHKDPAKVRLVRGHMERFPPDPHRSSGVWSVIRSGKPEYYPRLDDQSLREIARRAEELDLMTQLGLKSAMVVPLAGRERVVGALTIVNSEGGRSFSEADLAIAEQLGRQAALAIENAAVHAELESQHNALAETTAELEQQTDELQSQTVHLEELMAELETTNATLQLRTEEAEEANRAKSDFLATMSHELRTPLNAIFGHADLLDLGLHGPITEAQRQALDRIKRNQKALLALINDILNFARLEAGKLEINIGDVPVAEVLEDIEAVVGPQIAAKEIHFERSGSVDGLAVRGELERIEQILLNLLANAIKFTESGGTIRLSAQRVDGRVRFKVEDSGRGIPPERLQSIFDPFVQLERSREEGGERGVGLGLAISHDLAEAMGGELSVESRVGEGSIFELVLPAS